MKTKRFIMGLVLFIAITALAVWAGFNANKTTQKNSAENSGIHQSRLENGTLIHHQDGFRISKPATGEYVKLPSDAKLRLGCPNGLFYYECHGGVLVVNAITMEKRLVTEAFRVHPAAEDLPIGETYVEMLDGEWALYSWEEGIH